MKIGLLVGGCCFVASTSFANAVFPTGNFTVYGAIKTWGAEFFSPRDGVTVMAVKTNGTVLAATKLYEPVACENPGFGDLRNYTLTVPMVTTASSKGAVEGEPLALLIVSETSTYRTVNDFAITATGAGERRLVNVELATDEDKDGVADQYVAELAVDMYAYGYDRYDKDADWDEDGQTNYQEYLAGTNPFDASDKFVLTFFSAHRTDGPVPLGDFSWPVTFYAKNGRTYTVVGTGALETNALGTVSWTNEAFSAESHVTPAYTATEDDAPSGDGTTFYLLPVGDRHFWKVLIEATSQGAVIEKIGD